MMLRIKFPYNMSINVSSYMISYYLFVNTAGVSNIQSVFSTLMETLISSLNKMEMETSQTPESVIQQKPGPEVGQNPVENDVNPEKESGELPVSEVNQEPVETCLDAVVETDVIPDKKTDPEAGLDVNQKPTETGQETSAESDVNPEKRASDPGVIYRCKKCRRMLATREFVVTHEVGAGGKCFNRGKRNVDDNDKKPECPCIYVEPMKWMQTGQFLICMMVLLPLNVECSSSTSDIYVYYFQWKKAMSQISSFAWDAKLVLDNSTGLVCSAAVEPG
ncbi:unnamed protein product [Urochloa decumbens]|uniref:Uncharacterized protein n=1 Tax=Urochloa decumbens TaxID=240449 RepID=A0ABC9EM09_9POAL